MELQLVKSCHNYFTIILQSSVGTPEGHSEVGVYLASFAFLIRNNKFHSRLIYIYIWDCGIRTFLIRNTKRG